MKNQSYDHGSQLTEDEKTLEGDLDHTQWEEGRRVKGEKRGEEEGVKSG